LAVRGSSRAFSLDFYASVEAGESERVSYALGARCEAGSGSRDLKERSLFISFPVNENLSLGQPFSLTKAIVRKLASLSSDVDNIDDRAFDL
jgi:hypothetical protein